ncbi:MAG: SpoIID/LytB domain-containing protein [Atribacterota bacterium]
MQKIWYGVTLTVVLVVIFGGMTCAWVKDLEVTVAIYRGKEEVRFSSVSGMLVTFEHRTFTVPAGMSVHFSFREGKVFWKEKSLFAWRFILASLGREPILWGKRPYRGKMIVEARSGLLSILNTLSVEDYIKGTIKLEASPSWPEEALKAQIIVARTYAFKNLGRHREDGFDFCATEHCQRYGGINAEDPRTNALVEATRGMVLTYEGKIASVVYHSESGGYTDSAFNVWGREVPYLMAVPSPWEKDAPHALWTVCLSKVEIEAALRQAGYLSGSLKGIQFVPSEHGRMKEVVLFSQNGRWVIPASKFREAIGVQILPSTYFTVREERIKGKPDRTLREQKEVPKSHSVGVSRSRELLEKDDWTLEDIIAFLELREKEREAMKKKRESLGTETTGTVVSVPPLLEEEVGAQFIFEGRGWGHGVGLSQWGAVGMAQEGYDFRAILSHYFPGCELRRAVLK